MNQDTRVSRQVVTPAFDPASDRARGHAPTAPQAATAPPLSLIEILLHRKWTVVFWFVLALGLGALYQQFVPPKYESRAEIVVLRANPDAPASPLSTTGLSTGAPTTHAALLLSTRVLQSALEDPAVAQSEWLQDVDYPIHYLQKKLKVVASDESETVSISYITTNPREAAVLITAIVTAYFEEQGLPVRGLTPIQGDLPTTSMMSEQVIAARLMFLTQQMGEARISADLAQSRYNRAISVGRDINQLQQLLNESGAEVQTIGTLSLMSMNAQLSRLDQQLQSMPQSWGPDHRLRVPVQRQYDALIERYYLAELRVIQQANAQLESAHEHAAAHHDRLHAEFVEMQAQAEMARTSPVRVIDPPRVATRKSSPIAMKSYGVAGFLGLILGGFFAVRNEMRHPSSSTTPAAQDAAWGVRQDAVPALMRSQEDIEQAPAMRDIPLLGTVPKLSTGDRLTTPNFTSTASSIHQIRAVLQVQAHSKGTQSYAFTSPRRGAGKTSVTIGVASSLAVAGTRTLVVDCDLAGRIVRGQTGRPANPAHIDPFGPIDRQIASSNHQSLDDIAIGQGYIESNGQRAVVPSSVPKRIGIVGMLEGGSLEQCAVKATVDGLWLLPASEAETRHIGQMSDAFIRDLLEQAREEFDLVLFDTGPVPGSVEALLVTSQADGVVVIIPQGESGKALDRTMSYLKVVNANVIGTVFNHAKPGPEVDPFDAADPAAATPQQATRRSDSVDEDELTDDIGQDIDDAMGSVPLGSGILAAAVFADKNSGFASDDWELKGTSDFPGASQRRDQKNKPADAPAPIEVSDILPPE